jgi:hypothetical protein
VINVSDEKDELKIRTKWNLVAEFCNMRGVEKLGMRLQRLAETSDWVNLLWEAQSQLFEPEKVRYRNMISFHDVILTYQIINM